MNEEHSALKKHFFKLFRHMKWADNSVTNLMTEKNVRDGKAADLLSHIILAEETWFKRLTGEFYDNKFWKPLSLEACKQSLEESNVKFVNYISALPEEDFQKMISYVTSKGLDYVTSVEDILTHVALHGMYHRGQIILIMRNEVQEVVATDYVLYIREEEK